jgi:hypothetical protein
MLLDWVYSQDGQGGQPFGESSTRSASEKNVKK